MAIKWTVGQLKKKVHQNPYFSETVNLEGFIREDSDIIDVTPTRVEGSVDIVDEFYYFDIHIKTTLKVACARSLKPVNLVMDFNVLETFTDNEEDEYRQIDGMTIDLLPVIWSNVYLEKPMRVIHPDHQDDDRFEAEEDHERASGGHPALQKLKDYKS
ncbi:MAG: YceD family protein [Candidatus Izemoplasmataceae bacterium]